MTFQNIAKSMNFIFTLLIILISLSLVQSKETIKSSKSFKLNEKIIYDCVDIYKQPSLNHPLLKSHKIQMKPSFAISKSKNQVENKRYKKIINCPNGTVPILRNTEEFVANVQYIAEKRFNPFTAESHGTHLAGIRLHQGPYHGVASWISVHKLNISRDQVSYGHIYVGSRVNNTDNFIQTGWMINPSLFGDGRPWGYGFWKGANGAGCYNTMCSGFVQVSETDPLHGPLEPEAPPGKAYIGVSIQQDEKTGNWWTSDIRYKKQDIAIGYWPKELFDVIVNGVDMVGVGGAVESSPSGISPPMGNGHFPTEDDMASARVSHILVMNSKYKFKLMDKSKFDSLLDSEKCYGLKRGKKFLFTFGGPGGDSCGI